MNNEQGISNNEVKIINMELNNKNFIFLYKVEITKLILMW